MLSSSETDVVSDKYSTAILTMGSLAARGGVLSPKSYVDVPAGPRKSDYLYTNFLPNFPPISIPFSKEKRPIWIKLGAFYNNLPKIHPIYVIWAPSSLMKTPRSLYQISRKGAPKGRHIYVYHVNVRTPPPPGARGVARWQSPYRLWMSGSCCRSLYMSPAGRGYHNGDYCRVQLRFAVWR